MVGRPTKAAAGPVLLEMSFPSEHHNSMWDCRRCAGGATWCATALQSASWQTGRHTRPFVRDTQPRTEAVPYPRWLNSTPEKGLTSPRKEWAGDFGERGQTPLLLAYSGCSPEFLWRKLWGSPRLSLTPCRTLLLRELGPGADGYLLSAVEPGELALEQSGALVARGCSREEARLESSYHGTRSQLNIGCENSTKLQYRACDIGGGPQ